jgi:cytochrome c5
MSFKGTIGMVSIGCVVVAFSCTSALYIPTEKQVSNSVTLAELQAGRRLYIDKCSSCHALYLPQKYTSRDWHHWVNKMAPKAKVDSAEREKILNYVLKGQ